MSDVTNGPDYACEHGTPQDEDCPKCADWCDDCHGYTHMPWCPSYVEVVKEQCCPECAEADQQEKDQVLYSITESVVENVRNEVFPEETRRSVFADTGVIRAALADVVDGWQSGDAHFGEDMWCGDEDFANEERQTFTDTVISRIAALQHLDLGAKLENFCSRHLKARLPRPTVSVCADCVAERREKENDEQR